MIFKTLNLVYFSPTGTTRRTVHNIAKGIPLPTNEYDRTSELSRRRGQQFGPEDLVVLALPVYGGRMPRLTGEILANITGNKTPAVIAAIYGNRHYDDALIELKHIAIDKGFIPVAAGAFLGEHSYTRNVAANRPDAGDENIETEFGRRFFEKVSRLTDAALNAAQPEIPGQYPSEKPLLNLQIAPVTSEDCINCQTCVEGCPMGAIDRLDPRNVDASKCISCCYCVKVCPKSARRMEDPRILATIQRLESQFSTRREAEIFL